MRVSDMFIQFGLTLWEVGVIGVDSSGYWYRINGVFRHLSNVQSFSAAGALDRPQRNVPTGNQVSSLNTSSLPYIEILRGRDGRDG